MASPIPQATNYGHNTNLSSVTEEVGDGFEQSEITTTSRKKQRMHSSIYNPQFHQQHIEEETDLEEEEDEFESEESEFSESTFVSNSQYNSQYPGSQVNAWHPPQGWKREQEFRSETEFDTVRSPEPGSSIDPQMNDRFENWASTLKLPNNTHAFRQLVKKGIHPAFKYLYEKYPIDNKQLYEKYIHILSCVAHWSEFMTNVEYFPVLVFPFVKLIEHSDVVI